jgi:uncharacterized protein
MAKWGRRLLGCFLLFVGVSLAAAAPQFPPLTGRVVDQAGLLSPAARERLTGWLAQFEHDTGRQVVVATVKSLEGYPIADYGYQLGRFWGIGQKGKDTGAILLVAPTEHKVRIEVGYGLEGELTDAISSTIINEDITPDFRQGKYEAGIIAGTAAILRTLGWHGADAAIPPPRRAVRQRGGAAAFIPFLFFFGMIAIFAFRLSRHGGRGGGVGGVGGAMMGYGLGAMMGSGFGGGGGFTGGGGSFGGGGASGSW